MSEFFNRVRNSSYPYIIAEIGSNHNGDMELAKKLILSAKNAGADCVKFQSWSKSTIFSREVYEHNYFLSDDYRNRTDYTLEQIVDEFSISEQELYEMKVFADSLAIDCSSTPFSKAEADFLTDKINPPFIKIASMDLNNYPFLQYVAAKQKPIVLATGLSELDEIDTAIRTIEREGNREIIILHCVSIYPPDDNQVNLKNIETLSRVYGYPVGFSDHTLGTTIPLAAIARGAVMIEKHFTLDKTLFGWDHKVSANEEELQFICSESKRIVDALGSPRIFSREDSERKSAFRRSIVLTNSKKAGEIISADELDYKRPGDGISPGEARYVVGRTLRVDKMQDSILHWKDLI